MKIGFIGAGITGTALAVSLKQAGYTISGVCSRRYESAQKMASRIQNCTPYLTGQDIANNSKIVFITTPDDSIQQVASAIHWTSEHFVIHCSGAHSTEILAHAREEGAVTGCFHPLQTFAGIAQAIINIPGTTFGIEAEEPLLSLLKKMAQSLNCSYVVIKAEDKVLYHIAAVYTCNYLVTLVKLAADIWSKFDISNKETISALLPLMRGTLNNIENIGLPHCLTGPIARGDKGTILRHLQALEGESEHLLTSYKDLGQLTVPIALAKGKINQSTANELTSILK